MAANEAREDLRKKLILERELRSDMQAFNKQLVSNTVRAQSTGTPFTAADMAPELTVTLRSHYDNVGAAFDDQIATTLPSDIAETDAERAAIAAALASYYNQRAPEQAAIISQTNQEDIAAADLQAQEIATAQALEGISPTQASTALIAGAILRRKLTGRVTGISTLETQNPAEAAKLTEAQVLVGEPPSVISGTPSESQVPKQWVTVGDEKVRPAHAGADFQERDMNVPFIVGGQKLQYPGDMSLGANIGNTINCRCASVVSKEDVYAVRVRKDEAPIVDVSTSDQLLISLGE